MGQHSKSLGQGADLVIDDKTYKIAPWTYEIQGLFEKYLQEKAVQSVRDMKGVLPPDEYKQVLRETVRDITAGAYSFGSETVATALSSPDHLCHLVYLCMRAGGTQVKKEEVRDLVDSDPDLILEKLNEANADPNLRKSSAPAQTGKGRARKQPKE